MNGDGQDVDVTRDWDAYWRNTLLPTTTTREGGPKDAALDRFWFEHFSNCLRGRGAGATLLDLACGHGPVIAHACATPTNNSDRERAGITGLDSSAAALVETRNRYPGISVVAGNAVRLPFRDAAYDLVCSQFGMEYAGLEPAMHEACRVLRPGGDLAAIIHMVDGRIYKESRTNLDAVRAFIDSGLLPGLAGIFHAAVAIQQSKADRQRFDAADRNLAECVRRAEAVLRSGGKVVADGLLFRVYTDIGHIYRRFKTHDPDQVLEWLDNVGRELRTYAGRMESMLAAAIDAATLQSIASIISAAGLRIVAQDVIRLGNPALESAWTLVAHRPGN